ncbi:MAG: cell wall hydrolase, partial [Pararhizobium sp.]
MVAVTPVKPPSAFSAGSLIGRHVSLLMPVVGPKREMAFAKPRIGGKEIEIATAFYRPVAPAASGTSTAFASLLNDNQPDILAVAYGEV